MTRTTKAWTTVRTVDLDREQLLLLESTPGTRVRVLYGSIWLTAEHDHQDYFARTGDELTVDEAKGAIVESLGLTRLEIHRPLPRRRFSALLDTMRVRATGWLGRVGAAMGHAAVMAGSR
jgi:Protein of unknown function (DUF2917)